VNELQAAGEYEQTLVGAYRPCVTDLVPWKDKLGMQQESVYFYGGFRDEDGKSYAVERKFIGPMTGGLWLMAPNGEEMGLDTGAFNSTRGEIKREFFDDRNRWHGQLMSVTSNEGEVIPDAGLDISITNDRVSWREGDLVDVTGTLVGPGAQLNLPSTDEPMLYLSHMYEVTGTARGKQVEGFVWNDYCYWPHGYDWKEYRFFRQLQHGWLVFVNRYDDGTVEWGHLCHGRQGMRFGMVHDADGIVTSSSDPIFHATMDDDQYVARATFELGDGDIWEWTGPTETQLTAFSNARPGGYRAQLGRVQRKGDTRTIVNEFSWLECFAERLVDDKIPPVVEQTAQAGPRRLVEQTAQAGPRRSIED